MDSTGSKFLMCTHLMLPITVIDLINYQCQTYFMYFVFLDIEGSYNRNKILNLFLVVK